MRPLIFLSYCHANKSLAERVARALADKQVSDVWWDHDLEAGTPWRGEVETAVRSSQIVLLLMTKRSADALRSGVGYMWSEEYRIAEERRKAGERIRIVPLMAEDVGQVFDVQEGMRLLEQERLPKASMYVIDGEQDWLESISDGVARLAEGFYASNAMPPTEIDAARRAAVAAARDGLVVVASKFNDARLATIMGNVDALLNGIAVDRVHKHIASVENHLGDVRHQTREYPEIHKALTRMRDALEEWRREFDQPSPAPIRAPRAELLPTLGAIERQLVAVEQAAATVASPDVGEDFIAAAAVSSAVRQISAHARLARSELGRDIVDAGVVAREFDAAEASVRQLRKRQGLFSPKSVAALSAPIEALIDSVVGVVRAAVRMLARETPRELEPPSASDVADTHESKSLLNVHLQQVLQDKKTKVFVLWGHPGAGKSTLLNQMLRHYLDRGDVEGLLPRDAAGQRTYEGVRVQAAYTRDGRSSVFIDVDGELAYRIEENGFREIPEPVLSALACAHGIFYCLPADSFLPFEAPDLVDPMVHGPRRERLYITTASLARLSSLLRFFGELSTLEERVTDYLRDRWIPDRDAVCRVPLQVAFTKADDPQFQAFLSRIRPADRDKLFNKMASEAVVRFRDTVKGFFEPHHVSFVATLPVDPGELTVHGIAPSAGVEDALSWMLRKNRLRLPWNS